MLYQIVQSWGRLPRHQRHHYVCRGDEEVARIAECVKDVGWEKLGPCIMALVRCWHDRHHCRYCGWLKLACVLQEHADLAQLASDLAMKDFIKEGSDCDVAAVRTSGGHSKHLHMKRLSRSGSTSSSSSSLQSAVPVFEAFEAKGPPETSSCESAQSVVEVPVRLWK